MSWVGKAKHRAAFCCWLPHGPVSFLFITVVITSYHYYCHLYLSVVWGVQQEFSSCSSHAVPHTKEGFCFLEWIMMGSRVGKPSSTCGYRFFKAADFGMFCCNSPPTGNNSFAGPQQHSLHCPSVSAKFF